VIEEGIGVEARDDLRMAEVRMGPQRAAIGDGGSLALRISTDGLIVKP